MGTDRDGLRWIERVWDGTMANNRTTRIRFAMWDAMRLAEKLAAKHSNKASAAIRSELEKDEALFDRYGSALKNTEKL